MDLWSVPPEDVRRAEDLDPDDTPPFEPGDTRWGWDLDDPYVWDPDPRWTPHRT